MQNYFESEQPSTLSFPSPPSAALGPCYFSVVLPVCGEADTLPALYERLTKAMEALGESYELLFVDDGSRDRSYSILCELHGEDPRVRVLKLSRNFGHHLAITAGLDYCVGEVVVLMDSDLQDKPEEIQTLHDKLKEGYDVVYGLRKNKKFSWTKRANSAAFRWVMRRILGFEIQGGIFRILRRSVVKEVQRCREVDRIVPGLIHWTGFRQTGVPVEHGARYAGQTKYSLWRQIRLALNAMTSFSTAPLQIATWLGFFLTGLSCLGGLWIVAQQGASARGSFGDFALLVAVSFLGGVQLLCLGVLGEYIGRIFTETRRRPLYVLEARHDPPCTSEESRSEG